MKWPEEGPLQLPPLPVQIVRSELLTDGTMKLEQSEKGLFVDVPPDARPDVATVIRLTVDKQAFAIPPVSVAWSHSLAYEKPATASNVFQGMIHNYGPAMALDDDTNSRWATDAGTHQAWLEVDLGQDRKISRVIIDEAYEGRIQKFELQAKNGGVWQTILAGETVGRNFNRRFPPVTAQHVRLNILDATEGPTIWEFQLY